MNYKFESDCWGSRFTVPTAVVSDYISSDGDYIKVLLCVLSGSRIATTEQISAKCGLSGDIVDKAIGYWDSLKVISVSSQNNNNIIEPPKAIPVSAVEAIKPNSAVIDKKIVVNYSAKEIKEKAEHDENLKVLINDIQKLQFSVNSKELGRLIELYELYHFDVPSILLTADFCNSIGKRSIAYLSAVLINWYNEDIHSYFEVEKKIIERTEFFKYENEIFRLFGMESRLSKKQKQFIEKWKAMGITTELVEIAYNKCMDAKNKLNFDYIDGIIKNWSENGVKNSEQVAILDAEFKNKNQMAVKNTDEKKNSYDLDQFERFALDFSLYGDEGTEN